ncbi:MAG: YfhO family protein, partial [Firmicutes bacterium]|nr:YfhO family protein [Bacillota bacterium]
MAEEFLIQTKTERFEKQNMFYRNRYIYLAFILAFGGFLLGFAIEGIHPFGDRQILVTDCWHQYYPFFEEMITKLKTGGSLFYSWQTGMGTNFLSLIAYYAISPLNFLGVLFPIEYLREALTLFLMIKIGLACAFFAYFLREKYGKNNISIAVFGLCYAYCAYIAGYYWNVMWMDTAALLPLVVLGLESFLKTGRFKLFVISFFAAVLANYYIGFMVCIFVAMYFFVACTWIRPAAFRGKLIMVIVLSFLALGMTLFINLPAYNTLQNTYSAGSQFPGSLKFYHSFTELFANLLTATTPSRVEGLPNLFCSLFCVLIMAVYFRSNRIRRAEKVASLVLLGILFVSCNINYLDYIWHGMHFPNMIPARFSFMFSFVLAALGYRAYLLMSHIKRGEVITMLVMAALLIVCAIVHKERWEMLTAVCVAEAYIAVTALFSTKAVKKRLLNNIILIGITAEMFACAGLGIAINGSSDYDTYTDKAHEFDALLNDIYSRDDGFYRVEKTSCFTRNDPAFIGYNGISQFSSTANTNVSLFLRNLGISAGQAANRYYYSTSTPFMNSILNLKYLLASDAGTINNGYMQEFSVMNEKYSYLNTAYLPLGFMVDEAISEYKDTYTVFDNQNILFRKMTGEEGNLFSQINVEPGKSANLDFYSSGEYNRYTYSSQSGSSSGVMNIKMIMPKTGRLFIYISIPNVSDADAVVYGPNTLGEFRLDKIPAIYPLGSYAEGDEVFVDIPVEAGISGDATIMACTFDDEIFAKGFELLSDEVMEVSAHSDTKISGTITAKEDGLLYLSIPYEKGWKAYVDGEAVEIGSLRNAMMLIPISAGTHSIELEFLPHGFIPGVII